MCENNFNIEDFNDTLSAVKYISQFDDKYMTGDSANKGGYMGRSGEENIINDYNSVHIFELSKNDLN